MPLWGILLIAAGGCFLLLVAITIYERTRPLETPVGETRTVVATFSMIAVLALLFAAVIAALNVST